MKAERLKGLTDAVIAIASTIAVLELEVPPVVSLSSLAEQWPNFSAHFISFFVIYLFWFNHNRVLSKVSFISTKIFLVNGLWLSLISIIPFATQYVGLYENYTLPELLYALLFFACMLLHQLIEYLLQKEYPDLNWDNRLKRGWRITVYICSILSIVLAFVYPELTLLAIAIIIVINIVEILRIKTIED